MKLTPTSPKRADFRVIREVAGSILKNKVEYVPSEFEEISTVFMRAGGSWFRLFRGSIEDIELLKRVIKVAYDKGYMTRKQGWG